VSLHLLTWRRQIIVETVKHKHPHGRDMREDLALESKFHVTINSWEIPEYGWAYPM
jgi:hypothetical protein